MPEGKFVSYCRVSTVRQGRSGLGLEAQQAAVQGYLNGGDWTLVKEFVEIESGKRNDRPKLVEALRYAELTGSALIVAKLDRLSRDAEFLFKLDKSAVKIIFADMPFADKVMIGIMAVVAQWEREQISARTSEALKAAAARGVKLGGDRNNLTAEITAKGRARSLLVRQDAAKSRAEKVMHYVEEARTNGATTLVGIASFMNEIGIRTPRGLEWTPMAVKRVIERQG